MRTFWLLLLLLLTVSSTLRAQDHLLPARDYFSMPAYLHTYYNLIQNRLLSDLSDRPLARVVVTPSFEEEYVVTVDKIGESYYVVFRIMDISLWSIKNDSARAQAETFIEKRRRIGSDLANELNNLFFEAVSQTRYPSVKYDTLPDGRQITSRTVVFDGARYRFTAAGDGFEIRAGETHSPEAGTLMGQLVTLTNRMVAFAKGSNKETEQTLKQAAQLLQRKLIKP